MSGPVEQRARREAEARLAGQPRRLAHVRGVAATAERLSRHFDADTADCLVAAAWLHDIGYAPSVRRTGFHPLDGAELVRSAGFGELAFAAWAGQQSGFEPHGDFDFVVIDRHVDD